MRTWPKDGDRRGRGWFGGGRGLVLAGLGGLAVAGLVVADTSCSLIVDTNSNQCQPATFNTDCAGFPGFRSCSTTGDNPNICVASSTVPTCTASNNPCATYAGATCDTAAGVCTRPCTQTSDCGGLAGLTCGSNGM